MARWYRIAFFLRANVSQYRRERILIRLMRFPHSKKGPVINHPVDLGLFPAVKSVMDKSNSTFGYKMNSVLATCYVNGAVNCRLHDDGESTLDPSEPICVLSLGVKRKVEFVSNEKEYKYKADLALEPDDLSLYVMKPGCQEHFKHRVRRDNRIHESRISLSFRCFVPKSQGSVVKSPVSAVDGGNAAQPDLLNTTPPSSTPLFNAQQGFSSFTGHSSTFNSGVSNNHYQNDRVCLLLGSSITKGVDGDLMSRRSRVVINLSESGARIGDINRIAGDFHADNPSVVNRVDKILINVGTNEVKWLNGRKVSVSRKFRAPLCNLVRDLKFMYPLASIVLTCVLPIRAFYNYTANTVHAFNRLLFEVSRDLGCIFFDCFNDFLARDQRDYDTNLFRDKWHLNDCGLRLFCRALKFVIYDNRAFSFRAITSWHFPFYSDYM